MSQPKPTREGVAASDREQPFARSAGAESPSSASHAPAAAIRFAKGVRIVVRRNHIGHPGEHGEIVARAGAVFNGWTVRLDSGVLVGVADYQMRRESERERGY